MSRKLVSVLADMTVLAAVSPATAAGAAFLEIKGLRRRRHAEGARGLDSGPRRHRRAGRSARCFERSRHEQASARNVHGDGRSRPLVFKAIAWNESLPEVDIAFWRPNNAGMNAAFSTVKLTNASISSVKFVQPNMADAAQRSLPQQVEIAFTYQRIDWTWNEGGTAASDNWN